MPELRPPIILIASVRSGTTFTASCFKQHEGIRIWREQRRTWLTGFAMYPHDRFTAEMATPRVIKRIRKRWLDRQETSGGRVIMEKTPANCLRVPYIRRIFPEARIIHLVRDGRDIVGSSLPFWTRPRKRKRILRRLWETPIWKWPVFVPRAFTDQVLVRLGLKKRTRNWGPAYPGIFKDLKTMDLVEVIAKQWTICVETASEDLADIDPECLIEVKYEDLVARPHEHFQRFLGLAGLEMSDRLDQYLTENVRTASVGAWRKRLDARQIDLVMPILTPTLQRLEYDAVSDESAMDASTSRNA